MRPLPSGCPSDIFVKDDVGNWYVKAYAADTGSIIRSVQGLALFNLGKQLDVNLLQRAELRRQLADPALTDKAAIQTKIDALPKAGDPGTGAGTGALASIQRRYAADYAKQTEEDVGSLRAAAGNLGADLIAGWTRDLSGGPNDTMLPLLKALFTEDTDEATSAQRRLDSTANVAKEEQASNGADAIVEALRNIKRMRVRVTNAIERNPDLVAPQEQALKAANEASALALAGVKQPQADHERAKSDQHDAELLANARKGEAGSAPEVANAKLREATTQRDNAKLTLDNATKEADKAVARAKDALAQRDAAIATRHKAALTAAAVLDQLLNDVANRRLDTVKKLETALGFIGEAATEKAQ